MNDTVKPEPDRKTANAAWSVINNLIAGILVYGGIGWLIGAWLDHPREGLALGAILGLVAGTFLVYFRIRQMDGDSAGSATDMERGA